jgi:rod shape-determining protein MreC
MLRKSIIAISTLCFLFFGLSRFVGIGEGGLERVTSFFLYPVLRIQHVLMTPLINWRAQSQAYTSLIADLENSFKVREKLQQEVIQLKALRHYEENSKEVRDFLNRYTHGVVGIAQVLLKNFKGTHFYLIDAGSAQGIEKDMIAMHKDCLVGRVIEVYPHYSKVLLITDKGCKVAAFCAETNSQGVHEGLTLLDVTRLNYVNHLDSIKQGDLVLSSGEGLIFPHGFGLGRIKQCESDGLHYSISVAPLIDFRKINYCSIVKNTIKLVADASSKTEGNFDE